MKPIYKRLLLLLSFLFLIFLGATFLPAEIYRAIMGGIAGWQIGSWAFDLGHDWFPDEDNE